MHLTDDTDAPAADAYFGGAPGCQTKFVRRHVLGVGTEAVQEIFDVCLRIEEVHRLVAGPPPAVGTTAADNAGDHFALDGQRFFAERSPRLRQPLVRAFVCPRCLENRHFALLVAQIRCQRHQQVRAQRRAQELVVGGDRIDKAVRRVDCQVLLWEHARQRFHRRHGIRNHFAHAGLGQHIARAFAQFAQRLHDRRGDRSRERQRRDLVVADDARYLFGDVVVDANVGPPVRHAHDVAIGRHPARREAQPRQHAPHLRRRRVDAQHLRDALPRHFDARLLCFRRIDIDRALCRGAAADLDEQLRRALRCDHRQLRRQRLFES